MVTVCKGLAHYFDYINGKLSLVCRCGKYKRKLMR